MRTNIVLDDKLMREALRLSGLTTKRAVVEEALRLLVRTKRQGGMRRLRGAVEWEGNLAESRAARTEEI